MRRNNFNGQDSNAGQSQTLQGNEAVFEAREEEGSAPQGNIAVLRYQSRHAEAFRELNLAWIEEYFAVENPDRRLLGDPEGTILEPGGAILVAEEGKQAIGVCALLQHPQGRYEISKMAVRADRRGQGIGRRLLTEMILLARKRGASQLFLISNTALHAATHLYRTMGFTETPLPEDNLYARGNISMEMDLS